ncbi:MAG: YybS family protein [Oligoflexia bacterium]|nr:YybS family protein [Oligoflexia bacterium]
MFPWAPEPVQSQGRAPFWIRLIPFAFSAVLFLSAFFAIFAPLPLLLASLQSQSGRRRAWAAVATNSVLVGVLGGLPSLGFYLIFAVVLALVLGEALRRRMSLERSAVVAFVAILLAGASATLVYSVSQKQSPWALVKGQVTQSVDFLMKSLPSGPELAKEELAERTEELKRGVLLELPSGIAILVLMMIWANLLIALRLNPGGIRQSLGLDPLFFQRWKVPDWLVWPTIVSGAFLLIEVKVASAIGLNVFRFLMAIYAIQGLSILSAIFEAWNVRGLLRSLGFLLAVFVMMPLLLGLGFFDLWFDFRSKFRQS